ncbi:MAG: FISUMP domain-containing protein [bacterium]
MRKLIYIFFFIISYTSYSQSLSVFNVDASEFPKIKANYYAFDNFGYPITNLMPDHFKLTENGLLRTILSVACPEPKPPVSLSSVLVIDISGSMDRFKMKIAQTAAIQWINMLPNEKSECALTSFSEYNYLNQDFTSNKSILINAVNSLTTKRGTNYNAALIEPMAGGILIAKPGSYKRVIVMLTDGSPNGEPETKRIIKEANENNITIYCVCVYESAPQCIKDITAQTGGLYFENVSTLEQITGCYSRIYMITQGVEPCTMEWLSHPNCDPGNVDVDIRLKTNAVTAKVNYKQPESAFAKVEVTPTIVKYNNVITGIKRDTTITLNAYNYDVYIRDITSSNTAFTVTPTEFVIPAGKSVNVTLSFTPQDKSYQFTEISVINDLCEIKFNAMGGYRSAKQLVKTLKLTQPNGKEVYVVGSDSLITWEGVLPTDTVMLDYSFDGGATWNKIADKAVGLSYIWKNIPRPPSNKCLVRVTADLKSLSQCDEGELIIYNQNWMCGNLDVVTYRNGDIIPQVTDPTEWRNLKTGAWCYYDNNPQMGEIYGKLYNYYAVNDPRGLAPEGWHIPSDDEWTVLSTVLGGSNVAGGKLKCVGSKENGDGLWRNPNAGATNESDFSALPSGYRYWLGSCNDIERASYWWSSTAIDITQAWFSSLNYFFPESFMNVASKNDGFAVRCINDKPYSTIQSDTSNFNFTIAIPMAEAQDVDMKQCLLGQVKDSLITSFVKNIGQCKVRVDSIYVRSLDSAAFFLVGGLPKYEILEGQSHFAELRFVPMRLGIYNAELVIITQVDTIIQKITGESVKPMISVQNKVINFGKVAVGYSRDTIQVFTIKNMSDSKIHIVESKHAKPNDYDFTKGNGGGFDLLPHEVKKMDLSFSPSSVGRTSGMLEFYYNGLGSPAVVQLYGIGVELIPQTLVSPVNDTINVPIETRLYWNLNVGQTSYQLQVAKDVNFENLVIDTAVTDTVFECSNLDLFQLYYWRVKPGYQAKQSIWSPVWHFTTMMGSVNLLSPADLSKNVDINPIMNWENGIYTKDFRLQIAEDIKFKSKFVDSLVHNNSIDVKGLMFYKAHLWRVRNESGDTIGYWSNTWQFKTRMSDLFLIYPKKTQTGLEEEISFEWSKVIGAEYYQLQISKNAQFTDLVYSMDSLVHNDQFVPDLEAGVLYYWRVRVWNEETIDSEFWSDVWTFTTGQSSVTEKSEYMKIIPNPAGDYITLTMKPSEDFEPLEGSVIYIYNTLGEKVISVATDSDLSVRINISTLPKGMYFVKVGDEFIKFIKFIKL